MPLDAAPIAPMMLITMAIVIALLMLQFTPEK